MNELYRSHRDIIVENQAVKVAKATYFKQSGLVPIESYPSNSISQSAIRGICHLSQQTRQLQSISILHYKHKTFTTHNLQGTYFSLNLLFTWNIT